MAIAHTKNTESIMAAIKPYYVQILLLIMPVYVLLQSPFAPFANKVTDIDQGVFVYSAKQILSGSLIYKDVFDHKGPIIYVVNALGLILFNGNLTGIWLVELLSLILTTFFMFKAARLFVDRFIAVLATVFALLTLTAVFRQGDLTQEFALPFISTSLFLFLRYFTRQKHFKIAELVVIAFGFTITLLLLPTFVTVWVGFGLVILYDLLKERKYKTIALYSMLVITTIAVTLVPFFAYAMKYDILSDAIFCFWKFNRAYANTSLIAVARCTYYTCLYLDRSHAVVLVVLYQGYLMVNYRIIENLIVHIAVSVSLLLTIVIGCSLSGVPDEYYAIICIPLIAIIVSFVFDYVQRKIKITDFVLVAVVIALSWQVIALQTFLIYKAYRQVGFVNNVVDFIRINTNKDDRIAVLGNDSKLYYMTGRKSISKYHYTFPIFDVMGYGKVFQEEYCRDMLSKKPKIIIIDIMGRQQSHECINDILKNYYTKQPYNDTYYELYVMH